MHIANYEQNSKTCKCFSCGGIYPDIEGPTHRYMKSTPGCWAVYGEVLAKEYSDPTFFSVHRLTVDAYAAQHPGAKDRQSIQSVGLHLVRLCLFLEYGLSAQDANDAMLEAGKTKQRMTWMEPPKNLGDITAADVASAANVVEHKYIVREWAKCVWEAWGVHHDKVRTWLPARRVV